jgi:4-carboxymuconolactone decarboxylase
MPDTPTFGRYAEIPYEQMTPEQQEGYRAIIESRGGLPGPSKIWVHNPKLAKVAGPFGAHFHAGRYSLTEREREIAVCVITSRFHSAYPTSSHERRGKEVGLPAEKVEAIIACKHHSRTNASRLSTKCRWRSPMRAGSHAASTIARSRHSTMWASPT